MNSHRQGVVVESCFILSVLEAESLAQLCVVSQNSSLRVINVFSWAGVIHLQSLREVYIMEKM
jgi:hypothetical protein